MYNIESKGVREKIVGAIFPWILRHREKIINYKRVSNRAEQSVSKFSQERLDSNFLYVPPRYITQLGVQ